MDGGLASRYESGYASFDMKPGLLNGPNAKTDKAGHRYNVVPFTHSTPGSQRQKGLPMRQPMDGDMKDFGRRSKNPWVVNLEARQARNRVGVPSCRSTPRSRVGTLCTTCAPGS